MGGREAAKALVKKRGKQLVPLSPNEQKLGKKHYKDTVAQRKKARKEAWQRQVANPATHGTESVSPRRLGERKASTPSTSSWSFPSIILLAVLALISVSLLLWVVRHYRSRKVSRLPLWDPESDLAC